MLLRSETQNRDVYSRISIYQRPSDMQYFGRLQSNKYIQSAPDNTYHSSSTRRYVPHTSHKALFYILHCLERLRQIEAGHPDATDLTRAFSPGNSDAMDILTLGLGRVLGLEFGRQDVPGFKNTGVNFLASGRSRQDVADPRQIK